MRGSVVARGSTIFYRRGVVFGVRTEARNTTGERTTGVGGGREDKANQTVNNRGTVERKGDECSAQRCLGGYEGWRRYDASPAAKLAEFYS